MLLENAPGILWATDTRLKLTSAGGTGVEASGLRADRVTGVDLAEYLADTGLGDEVVVAPQKALEGTAATYKVKSKKSGRTYFGIVAPLREALVNINGTVNIILDATDSKP